MPLYEMTCSEHAFEAYLPLGTTEIPCRFCDKTAKIDVVASMQRGLPPKYERNWAQGFQPTVIDVAQDGPISFPMHKDAPVAYGSMRKSLTTAHEIRKFERQMNEKQRA